MSIPAETIALIVAQVVALLDGPEMTNEDVTEDVTEGRFRERTMPTRRKKTRKKKKVDQKKAFARKVRAAMPAAREVAEELAPQIRKGRIFLINRAAEADSPDDEIGFICKKDVDSRGVARNEGWPPRACPTPFAVALKRALAELDEVSRW